MRYIDKILTLKADNADNALFLGTALHTGIEKGVEAAINEYFMQYPVITDEHINESIKLEIMIPKAKAKLPDGEFEVKIDHEDFVGFIDLLAPVKSDTRLNGEYQDLPGLYDMYDFKYSNNTSKYQKSDQLHLYKYFFEKVNPGKKIRNMYFLCVPKTNIKQKKTESLNQFRQRILEELKDAEPVTIPVEYNQDKVLDWMFKQKHMLEAVDFPKNQSWLCRHCEYQDYCIKGVDFMLLPKNERRNIEAVEKRVVWLYGSPFSGKTTFANKFSDPLMLNTDGNIKFVDAPYIGIKDKIELQGRRTVKTFAWDIFKEIIDELEKKDNDFKTIVVDLLEDLYEYCRLWMYDQMGITHESDDSFRAWDKVRLEFLSTLKRLMALDYENIILISHEDTTKDITKKGGDKLTSIKPNLPEKVANKVAGMVDIVARVIADDNTRTLSFKTNEVIFGGGRLTTSITEIPLDYEEFLEVYAEAMVQNSTEKAENAPKKSRGRSSRASNENGSDKAYIKPEDHSEQETAPETAAETAETFDVLADDPETPAEEAETAEAEPVEAEPVAAAPRTRTRRTRRTEN